MKHLPQFKCQHLFLWPYHSSVFITSLLPTTTTKKDPLPQSHTVRGDSIVVQNSCHFLETQLMSDFKLCTNQGDPSVKLLRSADSTTVIGLIWEDDKSPYRHEIEQLVLWCCQTNLEWSTLKLVEMTVKFRRSHPPSPPTPPSINILNNTVSSWETLLVKRIDYLQGAEVGIPQRLHHHKGPAVDTFSAPAQQVQPASGVGDPILHRNNLVCSLHIHHCPVWNNHQTGQEQTTTDSQDCRENHWCKPSLHSELIHLQS